MNNKGIVGLAVAKNAGKPLGNFLPVRVSSFDGLLEAKGFERGSTILIAGGPGTGKTTFAMQSVYNGLLAGEKSVFLTFEEQPDRVLKHMFVNFGWDLKSFVEEGKFAIIKLDPFRIAKNVEATLLQEKGELLVKIEKFELPFLPDRIVVDSLSAIELSFKGNTDSYRMYIHQLFEMLDSYGSVNFVVSETSLEQKVYSRSGIEEFLADGVIILYNIMSRRVRVRALEILKLRFSDHHKKLVPFRITGKGIEIESGKYEDRIIEGFGV